MRPGKPARKAERAPFILFTATGERVPRFSDVYNTPDPDDRSQKYAVVKHGWKTVCRWFPRFFVRKVGKHYRVGLIDGVGAIDGSVAQLRAYDWQPPENMELRLRFPNIAAVEMYLRHTYGQ